MQFFDLNIPYLESDNSVSNISSKNKIRCNQSAKLMEFGYSGTAYNRTINGAMSQSDRCTISPFSISSILNDDLSLSTNAKFHRRLLGVPENCAFRQYSRLTLVVETTAQLSVLNSGNPVLKTYDLIAVRPLYQNTFDIACQSSQVDLISIDLAKLSFRIKLPMVKAAIARGVYFEITYSGLMQDNHLKRNLIQNAKLLVEWTRGKNLILSSAAPSVLELRGPNDVINLSSLFGLTNEFAKATITKNCRFLLANVLRKKQFHKEVIRVEEMPIGAQIDPKEPWIVDHIDWDPLSSGEGDLLLEDMAKAFAECGKITSSVDPYKDNAATRKTKKPQNEASMCSSGLLDRQDNTIEDSQQAVFFDFPITPIDAEGFRIPSSISPRDLKKFDASETSISPVRLRELELNSHVDIHADNVLLSNSKSEVTSKDDDLVVRCNGGSGKEISTSFGSIDWDGLQNNNLKVASGELKVKMDAGLAIEMQSCDQSGASPSADITLDVTYVSVPEVIKDLVADKKESLCAGNGMNLGFLNERNSGDQQKLEEVDKKKEDHTEVNLDTKELIDVDAGNVMKLGFLYERNSSDQQKLEEMDKKKEANTEVNLDTKELIDADAMLVDPIQQAIVGVDLLYAKSMHSHYTSMECRKQVQEIGEAASPSLRKNKLDNNKMKRQHTGQGLRFPFKRLFQFKKCGRTSTYKSKKRSV